MEIKGTVLYITSAKIGLHRFTYNELKLLEEKNIDFYLGLTQLGNGPCMPEKHWKLATANKKKAIKQYLQFLFTNRKINKMLLEARKFGVLPYFFAAMSFWDDIKSKNITAIHCQMGDKKLYIGYFLKKLMDVPLTVTVHAHELYQREVYDKNAQIRKLFAACDKVLTISDFNKEIIIEKFGVKESNIEIMRLFPDIDNLNYVKDKKRILVVANWVEKKGYKVLFEAVSNLKRDDFVVWVVGGSNLDHDAIDVNELIEKYNIRKSVAVLGRQGNPIIDILFESCDIFCLPSYTDYYKDGNPSEREGIPVAIMEAMAWGKPVIVTKHAGNPELVKDILVEERNVAELQKAIEHMLDHPEKWGEMGRANKEIIAEKFSKNNIDTLVRILNNNKAIN